MKWITVKDYVNNYKELESNPDYTSIIDDLEEYIKRPTNWELSLIIRYFNKYTLEQYSSKDVDFNTIKNFLKKLKEFIKQDQDYLIPKLYRYYHSKEYIQSEINEKNSFSKVDKEILQGLVYQIINKLPLEELKLIGVCHIDIINIEEIEFYNENYRCTIFATRYFANITIGRISINSEYTYFDRKAALD